MGPSIGGRGKAYKIKIYISAGMPRVIQREMQYIFPFASVLPNIRRDQYYCSTVRVQGNIEMLSTIGGHGLPDSIDRGICNNSILYILYHGLRHG